MSVIMEGILRRGKSEVNPDRRAGLSEFSAIQDKNGLPDAAAGAAVEAQRQEGARSD